MGIFDNHRIFTQLCRDVWKDKYSNNGGDTNPGDTLARVSNHVMSSLGNNPNEVYDLMWEGKFCPAGRILAGAGTGKRVTLMNCYVMDTIPDSLDGIFDVLKESALTMQQGGGIGMNFGTLRPRMATLSRTGSWASGPLAFIDTWDAMCRTIMSAGHRRGAMMATMPISHPDIEDFIEAKHKKGRWENFNVSVLVSDAFMEAVKNNDTWALTWDIPPFGKKDIDIESRGGHYVYKKVEARKLWEKLLRSTYEYAEPGIIFIDRVNDENNLKGLEVIAATNPCGEQPLPPHGSCNLSAINLGAFILNPFTSQALLSLGELEKAVRAGVRFLDSVIDVTNYPLEAQEREEKRKRRLGLGITGLADALFMVGRTYGSKPAKQFTRTIMMTIANTAYHESAQLAKEKGKAPIWEGVPVEDIVKLPFISKLDHATKNAIRENGLRNSHILTIAPTGTTSIFFGNISSGCEPIFSLFQNRKVRQHDDTFKEYTEYSFLVKKYAEVHNLLNEDALHAIGEGQAYATASTISVKAHVEMQAVVQAWVDSSVSKTVNCPADISFEDFQGVYDLAYESGCKGCTTYRPSDVRGSILEDAAAQVAEAAAPKEVKTETEKEVALAPKPIAKKFSYHRPEVLDGVTHKIEWPGYAAAVYITVNYDKGKPVELFISSKNFQFAEWSTALSVMISRLLKITGDAGDIAYELKKINLSQSPAWMDGKHYGSLLEKIGEVLTGHAFSDEEDDESEEFVKVTRMTPTEGRMASTGPNLQQIPREMGPRCPACGSQNLIKKEGCLSCNSCGHSNCG